jgi:hypothetical protein
VVLIIKLPIQNKEAEVSASILATREVETEASWPKAEPGKKSRKPHLKTQKDWEDIV